ncbi:molybdopterin-dependent oxidoreductase [Halomonas aquatica]|uniref:Molybdopterin-dependent oxidoreductase n=1 Tax=Halomonas aquatica TaxID=3151123 RepID=A0ABV1NAX1_9GAMM
MLTGFTPRLLAALLWLLVSLSNAQGATLPEPSGRVLLTVSGAIASTNVGGEARFDRAMLEALPSRVIETHTPWHRGNGRFEGPLIRGLLEIVGVDGDHVHIRALDDFEAEVPVADLHSYDVILAMTRNAEPLGIREFGPLFVLYPFDAHPELLNEAVRFRSVWHVERIIVP